MARLFNTAGVFITFLLSFLMQLRELSREIFVPFHRSDREHISAERDTPSDVILSDEPPNLTPLPPPPPPAFIPFVNNSMDVANMIARSPRRRMVYDFGDNSIPLPLRASIEKPASAFIMGE
jgi:hypothetical protein